MSNTREVGDGLTIDRSFMSDGSRYLFDTETCPAKKGWAQVDTKHDAWYFGIWINPTTLQMVSYCEGDVTVETADTPEIFRDHVREAAQYYEEAGYGFLIDGMCRDKIVEAIKRLGLGDLMH